ncbi:FixH family protein [Schinkia azotoformans]|uniref:FixH family protein n=1 Tax=Schinkia azotoformans TaxID=1454 RepID=UPI002DB835D1|nr:FixH family protein [Schinkia azotoformans]MEC1715636.1 FixH family protein [Schinkia azotoformans]MEC1742178.1 FixH family protein [Schinkia azotoformans]MEC1744882.1 FixH family protein [Schinkia azotoformans]MEC1757876.1 FixH family protein [Schinkia azotoformans]MEC1766815.1 FixH family protein [Schinkia azotoformans]
MRYLALIFAIMLIISGCGTNEEKQESNSGVEEFVPIAVDIVIHPSPIEVNKEVTFEATVTQGNEKVDDASDVEFEVWKDDEENHEKIKAENQGDGIYSIKKSFANIGTYHVIAHVQARDLHTMPQRDFDVVDLTATQTETDTEIDHQHAAEGDHHHGSDLLIHFMSDEEMKVDEESKLQTHITYKGAPLQGAKVRFEVWPDGQEKHEFIDAVEAKNGEYSAVKTFTEKGLYNVKVHVEKKDTDIHDHKEEKVTIQ